MPEKEEVPRLGQIEESTAKIKDAVIGSAAFS